MSVKHYPDLGINLFNPGVQMTVQEIIDTTQSRMTVLGNIPPRDVLASGTEEQIAKAVSELLQGTSVKNRLIASCGGGMPPGISTGNILSFIKALQKC
jgi:uroporphyrinogen decarboxylase